MSSNRPNLTQSPRTPPHLTLDEPSFQGLLAAAFTIQEHNERRRERGQDELDPALDVGVSRAAGAVCPHCGAAKLGGESSCASCGQGELRRGERLQRNWASMWLMSQEQGLWPERSAEAMDAKPNPISGQAAESRPQDRVRQDFVEGSFPSWPIARRRASEIVAQEEPGAIHDRGFDEVGLEKPESDKIEFDRAVRGAPVANELFADSSIGASALGRAPLDLPALDRSAIDTPPAKRKWLRDHAHFAFPAFSLPASADAFSVDFRPDQKTMADTDARAENDASFTLQRLVDLRVKLRFRRADVYLGAAVLVAALALLWPAAGSPRPVAPTLSTWERALVALGIAEAPAPAVQVLGDPAVRVWIDPHTALYYCPGEEHYGKAANGRYSSQREAQMDRFEPAGRSACE